MKITLQQLVDVGVCLEQRELFQKRFGNSVESETVLIKDVLDFDHEWFSKMFLPAAAYTEYTKVRDASYTEYAKVRDTALVEYNKVCAAAYTEYDKVRDAADAEYYKVSDASYAEYAKVRAAAYAECHKVCWSMIITLCNAIPSYPEPDLTAAIM